MLSLFFAKRGWDRWIKAGTHNIHTSMKMNLNLTQ
jgi:hypothetical protein